MEISELFLEMMPELTQLRVDLIIANPAESTSPLMARFTFEAMGLTHTLFIDLRYLESTTYMGHVVDLMRFQMGHAVAE